LSDYNKNINLIANFITLWLAEIVWEPFLAPAATI